MTLQFSRQEDLVPAFATPIARFRVADCAEANESLRRIVMDRAATMPAAGRTNFGGWNSPGNLLEWPDEPIRVLGGWMEDALRRVTGILADAESFDCTMIIFAWANVLYTGAYNIRHNHPNNVLSGVYYVDAGDSDPADDLSGMFEFIDPRQFVEMVATPGAPFGRSFPVTPEAGTILVFPSWLYHHVHPYRGTRPRISIAFNARITDFKVSE